MKHGVKPYYEGKNNFEHPKPITEALARERLQECLKCEDFKKEPISFLRIKDKRIKEFSEMVCSDCGCELPYKSRQSITICKKWKR